MKNEKYLPIGTVVLLKDATKRLMITGFCVKAQDNGQVYDYTGCIYPEGVLKSDQAAVFNHDQISKIYYMGYSDKEEKTFKNKLNEVLKNNELKSDIIKPEL